MTVPFEISLRSVPDSDADAIRADVQAHVAKLEQFCGHIQQCRVVVEASAKRHQTGNIHHVRIDLRVPGREIVVKRDPAAHKAHRDVRLAIGDAFHAARRQLEDYVRERRHDVKTHASQPHARVARLFADLGYGFLAAPDGHEVYFHRDAVIDAGFARLNVGDEVRFVEEAGANGPQASTVVRAGRHHHELPARS